ncbi:serine protease [Ancylothrix sp. D3o]|uniref:S1 family peptidase n=1 Tax=Ancylothrix sp. D3o TaxID=2953691 RepID=UPI0021BABEB2|nr:serine protease [Ancylothrix sp. D3o]
MSEANEHLVLEKATLKAIHRCIERKNQALEQQFKALKAQDKKLAEVVATVLPSVVSIYVINWQTQKQIASGSGFFVDSDAIITNYNLVEKIADENSIYEEDEGELVLVATDRGELRIAQVVFTGNSELDLAILLATDYTIDPQTGVETESGDPEYPVLEFCPYVDAGQRVIAVAHPVEEFSSLISQGVIQQIRYPDNYGEKEDEIGVIILETNKAINSVYSGGPLINLDGEVVGVNRSKKENGEDVNLAISSEVLDEFLDKFAESFEVD